MATFAKWTLLQRRADDTDVDDENWEYLSDDGRDIPWWYSETGVIVKWTVFITLTVLFMVWVIGGYMHAKSRLKKGLPLLAYHRCLVSRRVRAQHDPSYQYPQPAYYPPPNGYQMYNMPPPVYDPSRPPVYEPPAGGTKIDPMQARHSESPTATTDRRASMSR
ncbi:hypothetical protein G7Z17_g8587 [Cylindrodendrum hubeiense]|uniref:Uncharacterized protein n=1 Tax=Cylindrodendrum hubeiense TaxID=595255 RepID=A0A9P5H6Q4_9HYPO|nr:hypothetical protein G7Z17_g8587 [Cylindrodendrum hubeiense]